VPTSRHNEIECNFKQISLAHKSSALDTNGIDCNSNICIFAVNALDVQKDQNSGIPTEAQLVQESIELFKQSNLTPESVMKLQRRESSLIPIIAYLEQSDLPKLQRDARRLILRCADYHLCNSLLFLSRNAKSKRTENFKCKYQLVLPRILIQPVLELYHDSPMAGHGGIQSTTDIILSLLLF
jgi:hypothetical protein